MSFDNIGSYATTMGSGFFVGILIGYALKKVIKILAVIFGLFLAGLRCFNNFSWFALNFLNIRPGLEVQ